jgi:hypothetical protein
MAGESIYNYTVDDLSDAYYTSDISDDISSKYIVMYKNMCFTDYDKIRTEDKETFSVSADTEVRDSEA